MEDEEEQNGGRSTEASPSAVANTCAGRTGVGRWYHPGRDQNATDDELVARWARDRGLTTEQIESRLSAEQRQKLIGALRSLLCWWHEPIKADYDNPFWMEDEGYSDAEGDSRVLDDLASKVASGDDATERDTEGESQ